MKTLIDFQVRATLKKWPTLNGQKVSSRDGAKPYTILDSTLYDCVLRLVAMPAGQQPLYEIHTSAQADVVPSVLTAEGAVELSKLLNL